MMMFSFSDQVIPIITMVRLSFEDFKMCSETVEFRRRGIRRRKKFAKELRAASTALIKRKRKSYFKRLSLNQVARNMEVRLKKEDEADMKLFAKYLSVYNKQIRRTLQQIKDASKKVDLIFARVKGTFKFTMWVAAVRDFMRRIHTTIQMTTPWASNIDVVRRLLITLSQMSNYQTTSQVYWLQTEVKQMLHEAMMKLFWV